MDVISRIRLFVITSLFVMVASCGNAAESQRVLTAEYLNGSEEHDAPLAMREFDVPDGARPAQRQFAGVLRLVETNKYGHLAVVYDARDLAGQDAQDLSHLPRFEFAFVQRGDDLVPLQRGVIRTEHPHWEYILQPGRVWTEPDDAEWSRASLPFSLQERAANCTHNGVMTWAFNERGQVSRVAYQISSETCGYLKLDLWGLVPADFERRDFGAADAAIRRLDSHRAARLPVKPIARLAHDFPGFDPGNIGAVDGVRPEDMTVYGFIVDGVHYRSGCPTRHGLYPFCNSVPLPSYSTAKSIFAAFALMRMEKRHPGTAARSVSSLISECSVDQWGDVTLKNLLDMTTGNYARTESAADEYSTVHVEFLEDDRHATRVDFACNYFERKSKPGTVWVYHTSDTYLLGTALQNFVSVRHDRSADLYEHVIVYPIWKPLHLSPLLDDTKRTYDKRAQPFTGYGLTFESDDIARIAHWLSVLNGEIDGEPIFDESMFAAALQRNRDDPGSTAVYPALRYNNGFWGLNVGPTLGCDEDLWVPFMSGYGGITVAMFPNDTIYYYFSDGYVHRWASAAVESNKIRSLCE